ncbi:MAG: hypothetical protein LW808_004090 [Verrucomicrobiota bacterium]|nr:MAG: hypothetical protein LW808_004090 [Verrucomicrobiota bacterium]
MSKRQNYSGFTFIEMIAIIATIALILLFLGRFHWKNGEPRQIQIATKMVTTVLNQARHEAINQGCDVFVAVDLSTTFAQRRLVQLVRSEDHCRIIREILLPEHCFILTAQDLKIFNLSDFDMPEEEEVIVGSQKILGYCIRFAENGSHAGDESSTLLALGYGHRKSGKDEVKIVFDRTISPAIIVVNRFGRTFVSSKNINK